MCSLGAGSKEEELSNATINKGRKKQIKEMVLYGNRGNVGDHSRTPKRGK